jgi:hypothetical protein
LTLSVSVSSACQGRTCHARRACQASALYSLLQTVLGGLELIFTTLTQRVQAARAYSLSLL